MTRASKATTPRPSAGTRKPAASGGGPQRPITQQGGGVNRRVRATASPVAGQTAKPKTGRRAATRPQTTRGRRRLTREVEAVCRSIGVYGDPVKRFGLGLGIILNERMGAENRCEIGHLAQFGMLPGERPRRMILDRVPAAEVARGAGGLAHPDRVRIMRAVVSGACTHQDLSVELHLKTGPLYHHIRTLERAGLVAYLERNRLTLTEYGRRVLFIFTLLTADQGTKRPAWRTIRVK